MTYYRNDVSTILMHNGNSLHNYLYDEFDMLYDVNQRRPDSSAFTLPHNDYLVRGREYDIEDGLSYFGARLADNYSATWNSQDVYRGNQFIPESLHRYGYVKNNAVNYNDVGGYAWYAGATGASAMVKVPYQSIQGTAMYGSTQGGTYITPPSTSSLTIPQVCKDEI